MLCSFGKLDIKHKCVNDFQKGKTKKNCNDKAAREHECFLLRFTNWHNSTCFVKNGMVEIMTDHECQMQHD